MELDKELKKRIEDQIKALDEYMNEKYGKEFMENFNETMDKILTEEIKKQFDNLVEMQGNSLIRENNMKCAFCDTETIESQGECLFCEGKSCLICDNTGTMTIVKCINPNCKSLELIDKSPLL